MTSDVGGARDVFDRLELGRLAPLERTAIVDALRDVLASPPDQHALREAASRFSWEANGRALAAHLGEIAERRLRAA